MKNLGYLEFYYPDNSTTEVSIESSTKWDINTKKWIEYSLNDGEWTFWSGEEIRANSIKLRGSFPASVYTDSEFVQTDTLTHFTFNNLSHFNTRGELTSLLDYQKTLRNEPFELGKMLFYQFFRNTNIRNINFGYITKVGLNTFDSFLAFCTEFNSDIIFDDLEIIENYSFRSFLHGASNFNSRISFPRINLIRERGMMNFLAYADDFNKDIIFPQLEEIWDYGMYNFLEQAFDFNSLLYFPKIKKVGISAMRNFLSQSYYSNVGNKFKISETQDSEYLYPFRFNLEEMGEDWNLNFFNNIDGPFDGDPENFKTYYMPYHFPDINNIYYNGVTKVVQVANGGYNDSINTSVRLNGRDYLVHLGFWTSNEYGGYE